MDKDPGVGLRCEGRSGCYEMVFNERMKMSYTIDDT